MKSISKLQNASLGHAVLAVAFPFVVFAAGACSKSAVAPDAAMTAAEAAVGGRGGQGGSAQTSTGQAGGTGGTTVVKPDSASPGSSGDAAVRDAASETRATDGAACPAIVCTADCYGAFLRSSDGCLTCECAPPPSCTWMDCPAGEAPPPMIIGSPCPMGFERPLGPSCREVGSGRCEWLGGCTEPCNLSQTAISCEDRNGCVWIEPGCKAPKLASAGCHPITALNCKADASGQAGTCSGRQRCVHRTINRCASGALDDKSPAALCDMCSEEITLCL